MNLTDQIKQDIADNKILIYMKGEKDAPQCGFSAAIVDAFRTFGVPFATRNVLANPELREAIKAFSNWPTIPQIYINGEFVGGCDITLEMHRRGELKPLVEAAVKTH